MSEPGGDVLTRAVGELAGDGRVDAEDGYQIGLAAAGVRHLRDPRPVLVRLMRRHAAQMDPAGFARLRQALGGRIPVPPDRVLLAPGDAGPAVARLRAALGAAAELLGDKRLDPGPGQRFDAACAGALRAFQQTLGEATAGRLDSATLFKLNHVLYETAAPLLDLDAPKRRARPVRLDFYPGDGVRKLVVRRDGRVLDVYDMRGGPSRWRPDERPWVESRFSWSPTPPGRFRIAGNRPHVSRAWPASQVPFGAALRWRGGQVQFRPRPEAAWRFATGPESVFADRAPHKRLRPEHFLVDGELPQRYSGNDFGHRAVYLQRGGAIQGHIIHPTAPGEKRYGDDSYALLPSHGCEHMRPCDLDDALSKGYFRRGTPFVIHGYGKSLPADAAEFVAEQASE